MSKDEWIDLQGKLDEFYNDFKDVYSKSRYGRLKQDRKEAAKDAQTAVDWCRSLIINNPYAKALLLNNASLTPTEEMQKLDDLFRLDSFAAEMKSFFTKIDDEIATM